MARISPTIGRKLYYYEKGATGMFAGDDSSPFDATVVFVHPHGGLNLVTFDHLGMMVVRQSVPLIQEDDPIPTVGGYAQWMPYQIGQAAKDTSTQSSVTNESEPLPVAQAAVATLESSVASATIVTSEPATNPIPEVAAGAPVVPTGEAFAPNFGGALSAMKSGKKVTRAIWPDTVFVYYVPAANYPAQTGVAKETFGEKAMVPYMAYLAIKRMDGQVCVFVPGMDSILADDWHVVS